MTLRNTTSKQLENTRHKQWMMKTPAHLHPYDGIHEEHQHNQKRDVRKSLLAKIQETQFEPASFVIIIIIIIIISITKFSIVIVLRVPICHVIGARSRGCPITGVQFELFATGYLSMDTHVICTSITHVLMASFALLQQFSKVMKSVTDVFAQKNFPKDFFLSRFLTDSSGLKAFSLTLTCLSGNF